MERLGSIRDPKILDAVEAALDPAQEAPLSDQEYAELKELKRRYLSGEGKGSPWSEVKKRLQRELRA